MKRATTTTEPSAVRSIAQAFRDNMKEGTMERIRLQTKDGSLAAIALVLPFKMPPEVVIWGRRVFQLESDQPPRPPEPVRYAEGRQGLGMVPVEGELVTCNEVLAYAVVETE